jgi:hypothetical protein
LINHSGQVVDHSKFRLFDSVISGHHNSTQLSVFIVVFDMYELYVTQLWLQNKSIFVVIGLLEVSSSIHRLFHSTFGYLFV